MRAATNSQGFLRFPIQNLLVTSPTTGKLPGYMASPADVRRNKHFPVLQKSWPHFDESCRQFASSASTPNTPPRTAARGGSLHLRKMVLETMRRHGEPNSFIHSRRRGAFDRSSCCSMSQVRWLTVRGTFFSTIQLDVIRTSEVFSLALSTNYSST